MRKKNKTSKLDFNIVHDLAIAFAASRVKDYEYPDTLQRNELRQARYSNFLTDYAYVINQYEKACKISTSSSEPDEKTLNISITLFESLLKFNSNSD